jgi:hypothetical protein
MLAFRVSIGALWLNSARLLWRRKQESALWAAGMLGLTTIDWLVWGQRMPSFGVVVMLLAVGLILLSWRDLDP